jgi:hypothetical protein
MLMPSAFGQPPAEITADNQRHINSFFYNCKNPFKKHVPSTTALPKKPAVFLAFASFIC